MDTDHIRALEASYDIAVYAEQQARDRKRQIAKSIDAARLAERPTYPTADQRTAIKESSRRIKEGVVPASHHGDPCGPEGNEYVMVVAGSTGWMHIRHQAPSNKMGSGHPLWAFMPEEKGAILTLLIDEGLVVLDQWDSDGGLSVKVKVL